MTEDPRAGQPGFIPGAFGVDDVREAVAKASANWNEQVIALAP